MVSIIKVKTCCVNLYFYLQALLPVDELNIQAWWKLCKIFLKNFLSSAYKLDKSKIRHLGDVLTLFFLKVGDCTNQVEKGVYRAILGAPGRELAEQNKKPRTMAGLSLICKYRPKARRDTSSTLCHPSYLADPRWLQKTYCIPHHP